MMLPLETRHLFTLTLSVGAILPVGRTPLGERRIAVVTGGDFAGERLRGTVPEGGSDWLLARADTLQLDVRLALRTDDGALIAMTYRGYRHGPAAAIERLNRGEPVDPKSYYFRIAPVFETAAEHYLWLNRVVAVGTGHRLATGPV
ncbi:MAG: DUF3237 domain-containing protein, partial [Stellaceae bacterium]